jgi:hypothetical protein
LSQAGEDQYLVRGAICPASHPAEGKVALLFGVVFSLILNDNSIEIQIALNKTGDLKY